ncbi:hypothetical protein TNCV_2531701 [Trichonephila clavipes]|nr:hypothetical protein TNCV_2531701 [Trichonephila clavipes]
MSQDNSRSYPIFRNCRQNQLTPDPVFDCKAIFASLFKRCITIRHSLQYSSTRADLAFSDCFVSMSTMSQRSHLTDLEAWRVVGRLEGGQTQAEVAQAIEVSQSVISRFWNRFSETGSPGRRPGQGRR